MPVVDDNGHIRDESTGLYIPRTYQRSRVGTSIDTIPAAEGANYAAGMVLDRDPDTLVIRWAKKGTGLDDIACEAIIDGNIANVGIAPVISPQMSALLRRQQDQAATATFEVSGRKTPVKKARDAIARFNDSPLGITDAARLMVHHLRCYNRGCPIATCPIIYPADVWDEYGMELIPIGDEDSNRYYLDVDWSLHGTPIPYLPSIFDLEPTGIAEFPYWFRKRINDRSSWVLLHQTQIIPVTPGATSKYGIGTSSAWLSLGILAEQVLVVDERVEKKMNTLTDGLLMITGVDETASQIRKSIEENREEAKNANNIVNKGTTILTSQHSDAKFVAINFRQNDGVEFKERQQHFEDVIAACFSEPLSAMVTRGGIGYGAQAETIADNASDTGVGALLHQIAIALGAIYPRVMITVNRPNDRAKRLNIETLDKFSTAMQKLPIGVMTIEEMRAVIDSTILKIPAINTDFVTESPNQDESEDESPNEGEKRTVEDDELSVAMETLYRSRLLTITDDDVDEALDLARERMGEDVYDLLNAEPAEE